MQGEMERLENDIARLGRALVFPETPSLTAGVLSRIERGRAARATGHSWRLALTAAATAVVATAFITGVFSPARNAVADLFDRINIFETNEVPKDLTRDIAGTPLSFDEVQTTVGIPLLLPDGARPERALLQDFGQVKVAVLFYKHDGRVPYALFETTAQVGKGVAVGKGITAPGQAEPVDGVGDEAFWMTGLRIVQYHDVNGAVLQDSVRATDVNTLLWNEDARVFRIEGDLTQEEAIAIAKSLR
jgi:Domain of unknown function (DUF4367)